MKKDSYFIGVKFNQDKTLYKKIVKHPLNNSDIIRKSVKLYFRSKEPNSTIYSDSDNVKTGFNFGKTEQYSQDLVNVLHEQIKDLKSDKEYLQQQNNALMVSSQPLLSRIIYKLKS